MWGTFISFVCSFILFYNSNIAQIIVLEDIAALKRAFKNCQLSLICWLVVAGAWIFTDLSQDNRDRVYG